MSIFCLLPYFFVTNHSRVTRVSRSPPPCEKPRGGGWFICISYTEYKRFNKNNCYTNSGWFACGISFQLRPFVTSGPFRHFFRMSFFDLSITHINTFRYTEKHKLSDYWHMSDIFVTVQKWSFSLYLSILHNCAKVICPNNNCLTVVL